MIVKTLLFNPFHIGTPEDLQRIRWGVSLHLSILTCDTHLRRLSASDGFTNEGDTVGVWVRGEVRLLALCTPLQRFCSVFKHKQDPVVDWLGNHNPHTSSILHVHFTYGLKRNSINFNDSLKLGLFTQWGTRTTKLCTYSNQWPKVKTRSTNTWLCIWILCVSQLYFCEQSHIIILKHTLDQGCQT